MTNPKSILTPQQILFLKLFGEKKILSATFYLTGGTALAEYYIPYRYSEDLDFFSEKEIDTTQIVTFLQGIKGQLKFNSFEFNTSFNRNLFFLSYPENYTLKTEFTYFPFPRIEKKMKTKDGVEIDSILDIAVNKLFTIYQKPRSRDFIDLYMICQKYHFSIEELINNAKIKFDWHIDLLKLGSQFLLSSELRDYPNLIEDIPESDWQLFWKNEAGKLKEEIIK